MGIKLSVNINKLATLRNARGANNPDILKAAVDCQNFGADGITVHPRPDERHIRYSDVHDLKPLVRTEFNIEGYPDERFLQLCEAICPEQVTLVPDAPDVLTSDNGWNTKLHLTFLTEIVQRLHAGNMRVSLFLNPEPDMVHDAVATGADRIELYTEAYASQFAKGNKDAILPYIETAKVAMQAGLGINAGHDLDLKNLSFFAQQIPGLIEVSIGHALICDALYYGLQNVIPMYKNQLVIP